ncbi:MAG: response regulator transcription factor [Candidatus Omnitrophica bacterium]|nr:response regulator transcription factor [Candidatus Omnitrophota bacterium]MDE2222357.1 response regulator transcription factor [Candidatus Omnitrophota bacterium]
MAYQILVVDDDAEFREELRICLDDYQVIEAPNGADAMAILKKPNAVDLVILDAVMPMISGMEVLRQIKKLKPALAIIILTGKSSKDIAIDALRGRADDYIEKPINIPKFLEIVRSTLAAKAQKEFTRGNGIHAKVEQAKQFIERNFDKKIMLEDVAAQICLSPKYFSRVFKEVCGQSFNEYRLSVKINRASELLKKSDYTVTEIANQLGYENLESFIRMFEKITTLSPSQYRQKNRKGALKAAKKQLV